MTKAKKQKFKRQFLRPRLAAVKIKPRTEEYRKLHLEQQEKKKAERLERGKERQKRREERSMFEQVVMEQEYFRRYWEKECERNLRGRMRGRREGFERMRENGVGG
ncbi:MAG: hypothetical protein Q9213_001002 [Squamulea squamosa]